MHQEVEKVSPQEVLGTRPEQALALVREVRAAGTGCSTIWMRRLRTIPRLSGDAADITVFQALQDYVLRVSWKTEVREPLMQLFDGRAFEADSRARSMPCTSAC